MHWYVCILFFNHDELITCHWQLQVTLGNSQNSSDPDGRATVTVVRAGVIGDVKVDWSLGPEAGSDFYPPLYGSLFFHSVITKPVSYFENIQ